ncbi:MAG TPA: energy transducer TonB [Saprospiraceae bacterium]|nr:energy transducer TonB [Saprospiraceae bacterium]HRK82681.1 energy transducer TonB [Saprospiraceae bacterium]
MKKITKIKFTFLLFTTALMTACAQVPPADTLDYTAHPDIWPVFKGCETLDNPDERNACSRREMLQYIYVHFKMPDVKDVHPCFTMTATFIIEKDGSVNDAAIKKELHPLMDSELLRVINSMPRWTPAMTNGRPVRFKMSLPLRIRLE